MSNGNAQELAVHDRPLTNMPSGDLKVLASTLHDAIQSADSCGLFATAVKLEAMREPIMAELAGRK